MRGNSIHFNIANACAFPLPVNNFLDRKFALIVGKSFGRCFPKLNP